MARGLMLGAAGVLVPPASAAQALLAAEGLSDQRMRAFDELLDVLPDVHAPASSPRAEVRARLQELYAECDSLSRDSIDRWLDAVASEDLSSRPRATRAERVKRGCFAKSEFDGDSYPGSAMQNAVDLAVRLSSNPTAVTP